MVHADDFEHEVTTFGVTMSFTLDSAGRCVAARYSTNGVDTEIDPSLYVPGMDRGD